MPSCLVRDLSRGKRAADDQLSQRRRDPAVGLQVSLYVLLPGERHVRVPDAPAGFVREYGDQMLATSGPGLTAWP